MSETLHGFSGFAAGKTRFTTIPNDFFSEILPIVDDLAELKAVLYTFWQLGQKDGDTRYLRLQDVLVDLVYLNGLAETSEEQQQVARNAFTRAAQRGVLIEVTVKRSGDTETWYFLNSQKGREAVERLRRGDFKSLMHDIDDVVVGLDKERPNIFLLYEQNIGMVTPMLADKLRQAERDYPENWIVDAFSLSIERNKRSWAYISRILKDWAEHGKDQPSQTGRALASDPFGSSQESDDEELFILE